MYPSTISSWVLLIAKALDSYGCDPQVLFAQVGLDYEKLRDPKARFDFASVTKLWKLAATETKDPCFGLNVVQHWHPTSLHALGYSWLASSNIKNAILRSVRYGRIVSSVAQMQLNETDHDYQFVMDSRSINPTPADEAIDAGLATLIHMCRISRGDSFAPIKVQMCRERPPCSEKYSEFFRAPVEYGQTLNIIFFDKKALEAPLSTANRDLAFANDRIVSEYLSHLDLRDVASRVKTKLVDIMPSGNFNEQHISQAINLSSRTMQRRLKVQGTSYKKLLDETRAELAQHYIHHSHLSINEITFLLGFSEPANFSRAFKRWLGVSPTAYRDQLQVESREASNSSIVI